MWDGARIAEQRAPDGTTVQRRYYHEGERRVTGSDAGVYFCTRDHLGSIREMADSSASVRARYDYDPYGVRTPLPVSFDPQGHPVDGDRGCDFGFTGHFYHAETDLHLTFFRAYDQNTGRWLSPDPLGEMGGTNLYGYVENDPLNSWDPLGLEADCDLNTMHRDEYGTRSNPLAYETFQKNLQPIDGVFQLVGHGSPRLIYDDRHLDKRPAFFPDDLAAHLKKHHAEKLSTSKKIVLYSCYAGKGENSFAERLQKILKIPVVAATDVVGTDGKVKNGGIWRTFPEPKDKKDE